jgi:5-hydroxyisourate hydrolase
MTKITSHALDTTTGRPASGLATRLERLDQPGQAPLATALTDADGRVRDWLPGGVGPGGYRLVFTTGDWFRAGGRDTLYPEVVIHFTVREGEPHYHLALLLSPFGYTTYRGS